MLPHEDTLQDQDRNISLISEIMDDLKQNEKTEELVLNRRTREHLNENKEIVFLIKSPKQ